MASGKIKIVKTRTGYRAKNEQPTACAMKVPSKGAGAPDQRGHASSRVPGEVFGRGS